MRYRRGSIRLLQSSLVLLLLLASSCSVLSQVSHPPQLMKVSVLSIRGADPLGSIDLHEISQAIVGQTGEQAALVEKARHLLAVKVGKVGYLRAQIDREVQPFDQGDPPRVALVFTVKLGAKFRLRNFKFQGNKDFSSSQLEELVPLADIRNGDLSGLRFVYSNGNEFYHKAGYISAKAIPSLTFDEGTGEFDVVVQIDEGAAPPLLPPKD